MRHVTVRYVTWGEWFGQAGWNALCWLLLPLVVVVVVLRAMIGGLDGQGLDDG